MNDTLGHAEGDAYIKYFANLLRKNTRGGDILARMGGDECMYRQKSEHKLHR